MDQMIPVMGGAVAAGLFAVLANLIPRRPRFTVYGVGLVVAALVYVAFAMADGGTFLFQEMGGALIFAAMALGGVRGYPWLLALGWFLHVGWDVGLHGVYSPVVPAWYPPACVGFDLLLAGAILGELALRKDPVKEAPEADVVQV